MKRIVSLLLCLCMLLSSLPLSGIAAELAEGTEPSLEQTMPPEGETEPTETAPPETAPEEAVPQETAPQETVPEEAVPQETLPQEDLVEEETPTLDAAPLILTDEEFREITQNPTGNYRLGADITLSDETLAALTTCYFTGSLNGQGYTLRAKLTQDNNGMIGIFNGIDGTVWDLNVDASLSLTRSGNVTAGLLASNFGANCYVENCSVSGSITVIQGDASAFMGVGGFFGNGWGILENCSSTVSITVTTPSTCEIGGLVGALYDGQVRNSGYSGTLLMTQEGNTSQYYAVTGIANVNGGSRSERCETAGRIEVITTNAKGKVCGLINANNSVNNMSVILHVQEGEIYCAGAASGRNLTNNGYVKLNLDGDCLAYASGVLEGQDSENTGDVIAEAHIGNASAQGLVGWGTNSGEVTATTNSGEALAIGANAEGGAVTNGASVNAKADVGQAVAHGILANAGTTTAGSLNSGAVTAIAVDGRAMSFGASSGVSSENRGSVRAQADLDSNGLGTTLACGADGKWMVNNGEVTAIGGDTLGNVSARGISASSSYSQNYGYIYANNSGGHASAYGTEGSVCQNYGRVESQSSGPGSEDRGSAMAYGAKGSGSYNGGSVTATSMDSAAFAYGVASSNSVSDASVTAISRGVHENGAYVARASGSTSTSATTAGRTVTASGGASNVIYLYANNPYCTDHTNWATGLLLVMAEGSYPYCGCAFTNVASATSMASRTYDQEIPEFEGVPGEGQYQTNLHVGIEAYDRYDNGTWEAPITQLFYAQGNFSWKRENERDLRDPEKTDFYCLNLKVTVENQHLTGEGNLEDTDVVVTLTAPEGFSFDPDFVLETATVVIGTIPDGGTESRNVELFPIYAETMPEELAVDYSISSSRLLYMRDKCVPCAVTRYRSEYAAEGQEHTEGLIRYRNSFHELAASRTLQIDLEDTPWIDGFKIDSYTYNQAIAMVSAGLSAATYKYNDMEESLRNLGFSDIYRFNYYLDASGNPIDTETRALNEVAATYATKKIIVDEEVKNLVAVVIRGTLGEEWFSNFDVGNDDGTFAGFSAAGVAVLREFVSYMDRMGLKGRAEDNLLLITGHSRGGAVADLLADELMKYREGGMLYFEYAELEDIYCYTFAAPNTKKSAEEYKNVYNMVNFEDLVARIPSFFKKPGNNLVFGLWHGKNNQQKAAFRNRFKEITGFEFKEYGLGGFLSVMGLALLPTDSLNTNIPNEKVIFQDWFENESGLETAVTELELAIAVGIEKYLFGKSQYITKNGNVYVYKGRSLYTFGDYVAAAMLIMGEGNSADVEPEYEDLWCIWYNHAMETYIAWLQTYDGKQIDSPESFRGWGINCPVDVTVYDASGNVVAQIIDNQVVSENAAYAGVAGESKYILLPADQQYTFQFDGTGDGTMSVSISDYDADSQLIKVTNFYDIPVTYGEASTGSFGNGDTITVDGEVRYPDETLGGDAQYATEVTLTAEGPGQVYGAGSYTRGEAIHVTAVAENASFLGWYQGDALVSQDETYRFILREPTHLTAKFTEDVRFTQASLSLAGNIGLNYYAQLSDKAKNDPDMRVEFSVAGETQVVPLAEAIKQKDGTYRFSVELSARQMADEVTAQAYLSTGPVGQPKTYSVQMYYTSMVNYLVESGQAQAYDKLIWLMKTMLNYGAYSQISLGYNTGDLANEVLPEEERGLSVTMWLDKYAHGASGAEDGIKVSSASLLLRAETTIRYYFQLTGDRPIESYTFLVDGRETQPVKSGGYYYVDKPNISARNLDEMYTVTVGGLSATYGALSYVRLVASDPKADPALLNVAKALYLYNQAADLYFGS